MTNDNTGIRFCLYVRKSSERVDRQILSIESQINELKTLAKDRSLQIVKIYEDSASAHKRNNRPAFNEMLDAIENGEVDGIITWKADRLSRNLPEGGIIVHLLQQGIIKEILTPTTQFLPSDNMLLLTIEMGMANQYSLDLSRNIKRGNKTKLEQGGFLSYAPLGYLNDSVEKVVIPDPDRFEQIQLLLQKYLKEELRIKGVCELSKSWGLKTRRGNDLSPATFYRILKNPFYCGEVHQSGYVGQGKHKPMITRGDFDRIQKLLKAQNRKPIETRYKFPYSCLMKCGECLRGITAQEKYRYYCPKCNVRRNAKKPLPCKCGYEIKPKDIERAKKYYYYHCTTGSSCGQPYITKSILESQLKDYVVQFEVNDEFSEWADQWISHIKKDKDQQIAVEKTTIDQSLKLLNKKLKRLTDLRLEGELDKDEYMERKRELYTELEHLENTSNGKSNVDYSFKDDIAFLVGLRKFFEKGDSKTKDLVVRKIVSNPFILDGKLHLEAQKPYLYIPELKRLHKQGIEPSETRSHKGIKPPCSRCYSIWWSIINPDRTL